jgi:hypothetical protein
MLPKDAIQEFQTIYAKMYGKQIDDAEASRRAGKLLELYKAVLIDSPPRCNEVVKNHEQRNQS